MNKMKREENLTSEQLQEKINYCKGMASWCGSEDDSGKIRDSLMEKFYQNAAVGFQNRLSSLIILK